MSSTRMPLSELRAVVAIYGGRVEVQSVAHGREPGVYVLHGPLCLSVCADAAGAVSRDQVATWTVHAQIADDLAAASMRADTGR